MKISTKVLILVFAGLIAVYAGIEYFGGKTRSDNYRSVLVEIKTDDVTSMKLTKGLQTITLRRDGENWRLTLPSGKEVPARYSSVEQAVSALPSIIPDKMVARVPEKWAEYEVDTTGTRVQVYEGEKETLDIVLGKFGMRGQNQFYTFVRLSDEEEVYVANNFMSFSVPYGPDSYREQSLFDVDRDSLTAISFRYPADSSFVLEKRDSLWTIGGIEADSAALENLFSAIVSSTSSAFEDEIDLAQLGAPVCTVTLKATNKEITINAFHPADKWIFQTSENESLFADERKFNELFVGKTLLLGGEAGQ